MKIIEGHDYEFPVIGYNKEEIMPENIVSPRNIYGTAFSIGNGFFMTAGHSIKAAFSENDTISIGIVSGNDYIAYEADSSEVIDDFDVGFIKTIRTIERAKTNKWVTSRLPSLYDVIAGGFPYAMDNERNTIGTRSFKGYVVSMKPFSSFSSDIRVYELSFQCPRGLSGAALTTNEDMPQVAGIIVGNSSMEMNVFTQKEILEDGTTTIVERYEALQLGIAVTSIQMFEINSELLGDTLYNYLDKYSLLGKPVL